MTDRTALADDPWEKLELWLFRECNSGTRRHLWALFGLPVDEITNHGTEKHAFRYIRRSLEAAAALRAEPAKPVDREKVARALYCVEGRATTWDRQESALWAHYMDEHRGRWLKLADAAIAAMGGE